MPTLVYTSPVYSFRVDNLDFAEIYSHCPPDENIENIIEQLKNTAIFIEGVPGPLKFGDTFTLSGKVATQVKNNYIGKTPRILELFDLPNVENLAAEWSGDSVVITWTGSNTYLTALEVSVNGNLTIAGYDIGVNRVVWEVEGDSVTVQARFANPQGAYSPSYATATVASLPVVTTDDLQMGFSMDATITGTVVSEGSTAITSYGFVYALHDNPTLADHVVEVGDASFTGEFEDHVSLNEHADFDDTVYFAAYATNASGSAYGQVLSGEVQICLMADTLISLPTGSKYIQDITYDDTLLAWDFDEARLTEAKPIWMVRPFKAGKYGLVKLSDGTELGTVTDGRGHRLFNVDKGKFTYMMNQEDTPIGTKTVNQKGEFVTVVDRTVVSAETTFYNVITHTHFNVFANGILTSTGLNNIYPIENMKFVKTDRDHNKEEFGEINPDLFAGLRLSEQPTTPELKEKITRMTRRQLK